MARPLKNKPIGRPKGKRDTAARLVAAAMQEFRRQGFSGTDSNRIARRAGFAPQTFYRWFRDKTEVFVAAYRAWEEEERAVLDSLTARNAATGELVDAIIRHHRKHLLFRRSLRQLAVEEPIVRKARAESRLRQMERIRKWRNLPASQRDNILITLLQIERLADAAAEDEAQDLGIADPVLHLAIARLLDEIG